MGRPARNQSSSHTKPVNLQIWVEDAADHTSLGQYRFFLGITDADGKILRNINATPWTEAKQVNDAGAVVFPQVQADTRGGTVTVAATLVYPGSKIDLRNGPPPELRAFARYPANTTSRLLFKCVPNKASETDTDSPPKNKTTLDGKAGAELGPVHGEVGVSREHEEGDRTVARTFPSGIKSMVLIYMAK